METASISKLKASLSHFLCIVRTGEEVLVTDRSCRYERSDHDCY